MDVIDYSVFQICANWQSDFRFVQFYLSLYLSPCPFFLCSHKNGAVRSRGGRLYTLVRLYEKIAINRFIFVFLMFQFAFYQSLTELPKRLKKILKCTNEKLSKTVFLIMFFQIKILDSNVKIQESIACLFLFSSWPAVPVCTWLERGRTELRPLIQLPDFVVLIGYLKIYVRPPV